MKKRIEYLKYIVVVSVVAIIVAILLPPLSTTPDYMKKSIIVQCELKKVNYAIFQYANDNNNFLPLNGFITLYKQGYITDDRNKIKNIDDNVKNNKPFIINKDIIKKFVYIGSGMQWGNPDKISIFEPLEDNMKCANVAFANGKVQMVMRKEWNKMCDEFMIPDKYKIEN